MGQPRVSRDPHVTPPDSRTGSSRVRLASLLVCLAATSTSASAQGAEPRSAFVDALGAFSVSLRGEFGDEGPRLRSALATMRRTLDAWDASITASEAAMAQERTTATPDMAARLHLALGAVYIDRGRVTDGLRELAAAARADQRRADVPLFQALARSQLTGEPAVDEFRRAAAAATGDPIRAYQFARSLLAGGRAEEAEREFIRFLGLPAATSHPSFMVLPLVPELPGVEPFFPPARYAAGFALLDRGDFAGAIAAFEDALAGDPLAAEPGASTGATIRAATRLRDGDLTGAIQQLELAIDIEPERAEPHRLLGQAHVIDEHYESAVPALRRALALNPGDERSRLALADALVKSTQLPAAMQALTDTLTAIPSSGRARYELGLLHQREGRYQEALAAFDQALGLRPLLGSNSILQTVGTLHRSQQNFDGAAQAFSARVELVPNDPGAHHELGDLYLRQGHHPLALAEFTIVLRLDPASVKALAATAQIHLREARYAEAADAATRVLELDAEHREARYALATSLIRLGRNDEGRRELDIFERQQAEDTAARTRLFEIEGYKREAALSGAAGDHDRAIALLRTVVDADPTVPGSLLDLGFALIDAGRHAAATPILQKAAELGAHYEVHRHLAAAYSALGSDEDSRRERTLYEQLRRDALRRTGTSR